MRRGEVGWYRGEAQSALLALTVVVGREARFSLCVHALRAREEVARDGQELGRDQRPHRVGRGGRVDRRGVRGAGGREGVREGGASSVDVVTTGTFGPMCSSGVFFNFGHSRPAHQDGHDHAQRRARERRSRRGRHVPRRDRALADTRASSTAARTSSRTCSAARRCACKATGPGTDCYPRTEIDTWVTLDDLNQAYFFNPRNAYQNYAVAVNSSDQALYTYLGHAAAEVRQRDVLLGRRALAAAERPDVPHDRRGDAVLRGRRAGLRGVAGHAAQPQPDARRARRAGRAGGHARGHRRPEAGDRPSSSRRPRSRSTASRASWASACRSRCSTRTSRRRSRSPTPTSSATIFDYGVQRRSRPALGRVTYARAAQRDDRGRGQEGAHRADLARCRRRARIAAELKRWVAEERFTLAAPLELLPQPGTQASKPLEIRTEEAI